MAAPTLVFSEQNGPGAGTKTDNITTINFASQDTQSGAPGLLTQYPVAAGSNSFEKYNLMKVTASPSNTLTAFSIYFSATPPTDGAGANVPLTMKYGVTAAYTQPTAAVSSVATTLCSATTTSPGTSFAAPSSIAVGSYSGYFVQQLQVAANATGGNSTYPAAWCVAQYTYS